MDEKSKDYLNAYLEELGTEERQRYRSFSSDYFCADEVNANLCAELILKGQKTASCSLEYWYAQGLEPKPQVGHLQVVTDWHNNPICIIEITSVSDCLYSEVTPEFAFAEGEGDRSLRWWKEAHWAFFSTECAELNIEPSEDMLLVLERFKVIHSK